MKLQHLVIIFFTLLCSTVFSQTPDNYKPEREKFFDLVHTKLKVDFNFSDKTMNGEAWVTLKPHYYDANKVVLDANTMIISEVKLNEKNLNFTYNDFDLEIVLPKTYTGKYVRGQVRLWTSENTSPTLKKIKNGRTPAQHTV